MGFFDAGFFLEGGWIWILVEAVGIFDSVPALKHNFQKVFFSDSIGL